MDNQGKALAARAFAEAFAGALSKSLAEATGAPWPLEALNSPNSPTSKEKPVHFRLRLDGTINGECFIEFYEHQITALAANIVKDPEGAVSGGEADVVLKVISSAMLELTESLSPIYGALTIKVDRVAGLAFGGLLVVALAASADLSGAPVLLYFGGQLLDKLSSITEFGQVEKIEEPLVYPNNLKIVMDVELNVSLLFGRSQLPLREVLNLASGSVIELDRMVDEPVELLLDGQVIARGEAVIIDGNYGLRVTEIPQPVASHFLN